MNASVRLVASLFMLFILASCGGGGGSGGISGNPDWDFVALDYGPHAGYGAAVAMDADGSLHVAYYDQPEVYGNAHILRYATNRSGDWVYTDIDTMSASSISNSCYLSVGPAGDVHIFYPDLNAYRYATNASGPWSVETGLPGNATFYGAAFDSSENLNYCYWGGGGLSCASNASGSWVTELVSDDIPYHISLTTDSGDKLHLVYYDNKSNTLKYATNQSGSWAIEEIHPPTYFQGIGWWAETAIAVAAGGQVHIGYNVTASSAGTRTLKYITSTGGGWQVEDVATFDCLDMRGLTAIRLDSLDRVHITFTSGHNGLYYAVGDSGGWTLTEIDSAGGFGTSADYASLVLDGLDRPHVVYYFEREDILVYARPK